MLTAHLRQTQSMGRRFRESELLWREVDRLIERHHLPIRTFHALYEAANNYRIRNPTYRARVLTEEEITEATASRDLRQLVELGLLTSVGEKRGRSYVASQVLRDVRSTIFQTQDPRKDVDPFAAA